MLVQLLLNVVKMFFLQQSQKFSPPEPFAGEVFDLESEAITSEEARRSSLYPPCKLAYKLASG
jgi:hypothetical protein